MLLASPLVGSTGRVVAVEPSPSITAKLAENIRLNGYDNIRVVQMAASDARGAATLHRGASTNSGESSLLASRGFAAESTVETAPLGEILSAEELRTARLIKIDVEGFEAHVVRGLVGHLESAREDLEILMEVSPQELIEQDTSAAELVERLAAFGFQPYLIENYYHPHLYVQRKFCSRAERLQHELEGEVAFDVVFSRLDLPALDIGEPPFARFGFAPVPNSAWN